MHHNPVAIAQGEVRVAMKEALNKGWDSCTKQATELHTFCANQENDLKEGKGFYKHNEESIVAVHEDLTADYQVLGIQT